MRNRPGTCVVLIAALILFSEALHSDVIKIRHREGPARGFVVVRDLSGQVVGGGELIQVENETAWSATSFCILRMARSMMI
jgi:hypothetical protein